DVVLELARVPASRRVAQLERPREVARLLEVRPHREDLVDQILHADDAVLPQRLLDQRVVVQWDTLLVDLAVAAFVDQLPHRLEVRLAAWMAPHTTNSAGLANRAVARDSVSRWHTPR